VPITAQAPTPSELELEEELELELELEDEEELPELLTLLLLELFEDKKPKNPLLNRLLNMFKRLLEEFVDYSTEVRLTELHIAVWFQFIEGKPDNSS